MSYFTNAGTAGGPLLWRDAPGAIGVLEAPDDLMPVGRALPLGGNPASVAMWRLTARGYHVPGLWVVIDRQFVLVQ